MLDKTPFVHKLQKEFLVRKIVFAAIFFPGTGFASGVCLVMRLGRCNRQADVRETEKPKVSGWSAKRRLRIVDLPEPEGPEITIGRCSWVAVGRMSTIDTMSKKIGVKWK